MQDLIGTLGLGGYLVALLAAVYALLPKKGALENQRIDQLQEDINGLREELGRQRDAAGEQSDRIDTLENLLIWFRRRDVAWERREAQLMTGVERGEFPPWPAREGILTEVRHD